jgi:hypothetical protein
MKQSWGDVNSAKDEDSKHSNWPNTFYDETPEDEVDKSQCLTEEALPLIMGKKNQSNRLII